MKRMTRLFMALLIMGLVIGSGVALAGRTTCNAVMTEPVTMYTHVVGAGDTLWSIARTYVRPGSDLREVVYFTRLVNRLDSPVIYPGQTLMVPIKEGK